MPWNSTLTTQVPYAEFAFLAAAPPSHIAELTDGPARSFLDEALAAPDCCDAVMSIVGTMADMDG